MTHLHSDNLGTVRAVTNAAGARKAYHHYFPFGKEATSPTKDTERKGGKGASRYDLYKDRFGNIYVRGRARRVLVKRRV